TNIEKKTETVRLVFFYHELSAGNDEVKKTLEKLGKEMANYLQIETLDFSQSVIRERALKLGVQVAPSVVLDDTTILVNPSESSLVAKINEALTPNVNLIGVEYRPSERMEQIKVRE
ncbi:MAG: hypothetical protein PXY39_10235, partial [archaeon]|nr:hypothetical protein [archaeon]